MDGWTYQERYVRCGKASCGKCQSGPGHGPYWYGYIHRDGRMHSKYFGKQHPQGEAGARSSRNYSDSYAQREWRNREEQRRNREERVPAPDRWTRPRRMDAGAAMRILGFATYPSQAALYKRYRELMNVWHPDHGGENRIAVALNLAYAYLRRS